MQDMRPKMPKNLNPLARELLESLAGHPEAAEIVLGGGGLCFASSVFRCVAFFDGDKRGGIRLQRLSIQFSRSEALAVRIQFDVSQTTIPPASYE